MVKTPSDRGQSIVLFAATLPFLFVLLGGLIDMMGAVITYHRAIIALDSATFAASQAIDLDVFDHEQRMILDPDVARQLAGQYMSINQRGVMVGVSFYIVDDTVYGEATAVYNTVMLGAIGISNIRMHVTSTGLPEWGVHEEFTYTSDRVMCIHFPQSDYPPPA
jgi:hypothetical protein